MTIPWALEHLFSRTAAAPSIEPELARWRTLLQRASESPYYSTEKAFFENAAGRSSVCALRQHWEAVRPLPLSWFVENPQAFRSGFRKVLPAQASSTFWDTKSRIALVHPWFRTEKPAQTFAKREPLADTAKRVNSFRPDIIVATPRLLMRMARTTLAEPARAIVAIHGPGTALLREDERDLLWQRFKVPVYQQLRGFQGELLAAECDAQVGFHANRELAYWETRQQELLYTSLFDLRHPVLRLATGWYGDLETSRCACGCLSPRIFPYERQTALRRATELYSSAVMTCN